MAFNQDQLRNAAIIYQVGQSMGLGARDIQTAIITAMVESNLINVGYGDRDSLGLFQQRPSQGWGSPEQVMDPVYAAKQFFKHLLSIGPKRFSMDMGAVAQSVQRSAFPGRYAQEIPGMKAAWPDIADAAGDTQIGMDGQPYSNLPRPNASPLGPLAAVSQMPLAAAPGVSVGAADGSMVSAPDPLTDGSQSFLSDGTNQILRQKFQTQGSYQTGVDGWRKAVLDAARGALGTPYSWGGTNLNTGVDCSGLVQAAFALAGINLPRVSYQQAGAGKRVGLKGLVPGDLVAWDNSSRNNGADHIAIYLGNGKIIEAPYPGQVVRIRSIGSGLEGGWGVHLNF